MPAWSGVSTHASGVAVVPIRHPDDSQSPLPNVATTMLRLIVAPEATVIVPEEPLSAVLV